MNSAYIPALAALAGSALGALASFATTWLTQNFQERTQRQSQSVGRRERLYGEFIEEASSLFGDALLHHLSDATRMINLYAIRSKLRLFAPTAVTDAADDAMRLIIQTYSASNLTLDEIHGVDQAKIDFLRVFTERCRDDLLG